MKYNTRDYISKEDKLLDIIKQSRSFKALVSSFEDGEDITGNLLELAFTRHYPKPSNQPYYDASIGGMTREPEGQPTGYGQDEETVDKVEKKLKRSDLVVDKLHGEVYYE